MDNSLREFMWLQWHGQLPPMGLQFKEVLFALAVAALLLLSWLAVRRACFYIASGPGQPGLGPGSSAVP